MTTACAPGKIILFGEHAVVYGRPALAVPVQQVQAQASIEKTGEYSGENWADSVLVQAPDIGLFSSLSVLQAHHPPHPLAAVIEKTLQRLNISQPPALSVTIRSTIPVASGLGSGAAVSVAVIRALAGLFGQPLPDAQISQIAYEIEKLHHGTPSGIDNTVITYAKPVYFVRGEPIETLTVARPFSLLIADTGIAAPTKESVADLRKLWQAAPAKWEKVFDQVGQIVQSAKKAIESGQTAQLGPLMDANQSLLQKMGVSSSALDRLVLAAKAGGADGAKLSGGGRGGNMIALAQSQSAEAVASALKAAGAKNVIITQVG
ncbi:MAG: mevalonate kinase [Anaerolineales bacterium]|jgi:mevalonate kinase|nr:mevalonate kinase [Anaerolineales bacterium]